MSTHGFTNKLINETSPYLLQHAHNPVDWYPWGEEAFTKAKTENKPILLSVGYSACHWCHVMEHESFENEAIAQLMNENFVNIKVDREERPDVDQIYMNAVQMMTHHGGWPMTVFLTPQGVPFYGGTYFPPVDRYNVPAFPRVLESVASAFRERPDDIEETANSVLSELKRLSTANESRDLLSTELLDNAYAGTVRNYDLNNGGFGSAPKFPPAMSLEFLLRTYVRTQKQEALDIVRTTCNKMAQGGIYDQLGGGFHRYSTDAEWLVPHFEKMLYDNALLSRLYLHYYQLTKDDFARQIAEGILDYVIGEMTHANGGFYSTQDADSEGHEGKFFVWSFDEIVQFLGSEDAKLFGSYYDVTPEGNFEGKNILHVSRTEEEIAREFQISVERLQTVLSRCRKTLLGERAKRVRPDRDDKILTAWNGLMMASFAEAGAILDRADYLDTAKKNATFVLGNLEREGLLLRTFKDGQAKLNGYLEDYAFYSDALLSLYESTGELRWLKESLRLTDKMLSEFWDEQEGGLFFTGKSHEQLIVRTKDYFDNATPSGNSVAADLLLRLGLLTDNENYKRRAVTILRLVAETARRFPAGFGRALCALDFHLGRPKEIALIGDPGTNEYVSLVREVWRGFLPNKVLAQSSPDNPEALEILPLLRDRPQIEGKPTAYVCENYTCKQPVSTPNDLANQLTHTS
jgi:uncharacterized protein